MNWRNVSINDCEFSVRTVNSLQAYGRFLTLGALDAVSDSHLLGIRMFGRKSLNEVREMIAMVRERDERGDDIAEWARAHADLIRDLMKYVP
jgi:DNA-directed RNA polymerase alpha subunit